MMSDRRYTIRTISGEPILEFHAYVKEIHFGLRYGKPRREPKLPRKAKKYFKTLQTHAVEFDTAVFDMLAK